MIDLFWKSFGSLYSLEFVMLLLSAVAAYKIGDLEDCNPLLSTTLAVGAYLLTWRYLGWHWLGCLFGQVILVAVVTLVRTVLHLRSHR